MFRFFSRLTTITGAVVVTAVVYVGLVFDGATDHFYLRFTTPRAPSLVLGSSRAAQGIVPSVIEESAHGFEWPLYNFSFTLGHSPYGPAYLDLAKRKLDGGRTGLHLVTVDPWSIANGPEESDDDIETLRESPRFSTRIWTVASNPNLEYAFRFYGEPLYFALVHRIRGPEYVAIQSDGWLRVDVPMDSTSVRMRRRGRLDIYRGYQRHWRVSALRVRFLERTVAFLAQRGTVLLVRLPVSPEMRVIEDLAVPEFDSLIAGIARRQGVKYLNLIEMSGRFQTTDGNHLWRGAARTVSSILADSLATPRYP